MSSAISAEPSGAASVTAILAYVLQELDVVLPDPVLWTLLGLSVLGILYAIVGWAISGVGEAKVGRSHSVKTGSGSTTRDIHAGDIYNIGSDEEE